MISEECGWLLRVGLIVVDESLPNPLIHDVPAKLGIVPARSWNRGDLVSTRGDRRWKISGFRHDFYHGYDGDAKAEVERAVAWLSAAGAASILEPYDAHIAITIKLYGEKTYPTPELYFLNETVTLVSDLGLSIDIDLYVWSGKPVLRN